MANPKLAPAYRPNLTLYTPVFDRVCLSLSKKRQELFRRDINEYMCFCIESNDEAKKFTESIFKLIKQLKNTDASLSKTLSKTFAGIFMYLDVEFKKQNRTIQLLNKEITPNTLSNDSSLSGFLVENFKLPVDQFYPKYAAFLVEHLLLKYKKEFEKFKTLNIPKILENELSFVNCHSRYSYQQGNLRAMSDAIKLVNEKVSGLVKSITIQAS